MRSQLPGVSVAPPAWATSPVSGTSAGPEVALFAERNGLLLDDWQRLVLDAALGERADGTWASFEVGLCCPRQNGKSAVLEALMLASLFLDGGLTIYSAHEFKTAQELYRRVNAIILGNPDLEVQIKRRVSNTNEMGFELHDTSRLRFLARSGGSGRGFSGDRLIFDEAMILPATSMGAMLPTLSARPNPQVWYAGSAGMAESVHWRAVRNRGRAHTSDRLTWLEWGCDTVDDPADRGLWYRANPSLGIRLREDVIESEFQSLGGAAETLPVWLRERLGVWDEPDLEGLVIPAAIWDLHLEPAEPSRPVFAVDVSPLRDHAVIAACSDANGRPLVELTAANDGLDYRPGTDWVVARLADLAERHSSRTVSLVGNAALSLQPDLEAAGLTVEALNGAQFAQACGLFFDAAMAPRGSGLIHSGQPELAGALALARRAETEHGWTWGRRKSAGDISPVVAATVALWAYTVGRNNYDVLQSAW